MAYHLKTSILELYKFTLRELLVSYETINNFVMQDIAKDMSLAGGDGKKFLEDNASQSEDYEEFEVEEEKLYKALKGLK